MVTETATESHVEYEVRQSIAEHEAELAEFIAHGQATEAAVADREAKIAHLKAILENLLAVDDEGLSANG